MILILCNTKNGLSCRFWIQHCDLIITTLLIKFEMMTSSWILNSKLVCWEVDFKNNHEMEHEIHEFWSHLLLSSARIFNAFFAMNFSREWFSWDIFVFYWCSLVMNKKWQANKLENRWFDTSYTSGVYEPLHSNYAFHKVWTPLAPNLTRFWPMDKQIWENGKMTITLCNSYKIL